MPQGLYIRNEEPRADLSRGATITDIVKTVAITAVQAQSKGLEK